MLPVILNKTPAPHLSDRYVLVDTEEVLRAMTAEGFTVASMKTTKSRKTAGEYARHVIDFRHPDAPGIEGAVPRVLFSNSHDGSSRATAFAGVFRFACENGLVIGSVYAREIQRHSGAAAMDLVSRMQALAKNTAPLFAQIEKWQKKELTATQAENFAMLAAQLRWGDPYRFDTADLLAVRREEDDSNSLWHVFNRVQEATTKGGAEGTTRSGRVTTARPLLAPASDITFNANLWTLAEEFAGL